MAIEITRKELTAAELRSAASKTNDARAARRMLALALVLEGSDRKTAAESCGMERQTLRDWVHRYNAELVAGLRDRPRPGQPPHLTVDQVERFKERIRKGARSEDRVCVLRGMDVQRILQEEFEAQYSLPGVYFLLHRLEFSSLVPRPKHEKADEQAQAAFKKTSPSVSKKSGRNIPTRGSRSGSKTKRASASKGH